MNQQETPIVSTLTTLVNSSNSPFYAPGHKRGKGASKKLTSLLGKNALEVDFPELPELDNLFAPHGVIEKAQNLAAQAFGADRTWFLINGSSGGIIAGILATCNQGDKIILPRNIHLSVLSGLILSGAIPIFINPEYDAAFDVVNGVTPETVADALRQHPEAKAVMVVYPTYHGVCSDLSSIAQLTHQHHLPLLVDEAHGAHLAFHPHLPPSALACGADLVVQSTHKVLGAMTQASMLHTQGERIDKRKLERSLQLTQSTSPNYLLLASLDAARQQMAIEGKELMSRTLQLAEIARREIANIPRLKVLEGHNLDITRLTIKVSELGLTGFEADELLHQHLEVTAELPLLHHLTFIISLGNTTQDIDNLVKGFSLLAQNYSSSSSVSSFSLFEGEQNMKLSPREAFFAPLQRLSIEKCKGKISGEMICPYPPGIPVVMPGEIITQDAIFHLQKLLSLGAQLTGCADPTLQTLVVV